VPPGQKQHTPTKNNLKKRKTMKHTNDVSLSYRRFRITELNIKQLKDNNHTER